MAELLGYTEDMLRADIRSFAELQHDLTPEEHDQPDLLAGFGWTPEKALRTLDDQGISASARDLVLLGESPFETRGLRLDIVAAWIVMSRSPHSRRLEGVVTKYSRNLLGIKPTLRPIYSSTDAPVIDV